jgi:hypothetical protein
MSSSLKIHHGPDGFGRIKGITRGSLRHCEAAKPPKQSRAMRGPLDCFAFGSQ